MDAIALKALRTGDPVGGADSVVFPGSKVAPVFRERPRALFILADDTLDCIYGETERDELARLADFYAPPQTRESIGKNLSLLESAEVIFSGWGAPKMDAAFLKAAPNLRAVFYGAGTIGYFTSPEFWEREIVVTSAYAANAIPVAEYTLAAILFSLKNFWQFSAAVRQGKGWGDHTRQVPGNFRSTVGLISCGMIGRQVTRLLKSFNLHCLVYDPFLSPEEAAMLGVELCSLDDIFQRSDVVSLHAPDKPETHGMITGAHFSQMKQGATFLNTARPRIIRQQELLDVLQQRPDLTAILDVCEPEPAPVDSPLLTVPNLILTPHIAGSLGPECRRLGAYMVDEFKRYLAGEPLQWQISRELSARLA
ncbi:MAG: hydroxyacid dehydrogenase [Chthoniobacteraceae bacterium]